ncbi:MAG: hypothetical protein AAB328_09085, partial [candidate division NC10 bacterium]
MPRRIVWYPDGSPVARLVAALPAPFEGHPLSEVATPRRRADDPGPADEGAELRGREATGMGTEHQAREDGFDV